MSLLGKPCAARVYAGGGLQLLAAVWGTLRRACELGEGPTPALVLDLSSQLLVVDGDRFVSADRSEAWAPRDQVASTVLTVAFEDGSLIEVEHDRVRLGS